jgi:hypothetical protein
MKLRIALANRPPRLACGARGPVNGVPAVVAGLTDRGPDGVLAGAGGGADAEALATLGRVATPPTIVADAGVAALSSLGDSAIVV